MMAAELHRPPDVTEAIRALAAQGLRAFDIAERLCIGVAAVEQALPRVDGIAAPLAQVTIDDVQRLHRLGNSAASIAATLNLSVMDVERTLQRLQAVATWSECMKR
jgi:DNA-binding CsgD family transcriptional regulator